MRTSPNQLIPTHLSNRTVTLTDDLTLSDSFNVLDDLTINLNGHTITYEGSSDQLFNVTGTATLTINGTGDKNDASSIFSSALIATTKDAGSTVIINGGTHETSSPTLYRSEGGIINIVKGKFQSTYTTNLFSQSDNGKVKITGGSFYNWDPQNFIWDETTQANFKPIYYKPASDDIVMHDRQDWYHIKKRVTADPDNGSTNDADHFREVLQDNEIGHITLNSNVTTTTPFSIKNDVIIDFNNCQSTITDPESQWYGIYINGVQVEIYNMNLTSSDGIQIQNSANVVIFGNSLGILASKNSRNMFNIIQSTLTIEGGDYFFDDSRSGWFYLQSGAVLNIKGGNWGINSQSWTLKGNGGSGKLNFGGGELYISGGNFDFNFSKVNVPDSKIVITGGSFTNRPPDKSKYSDDTVDYIPDGYEAVQDKNYKNKWDIIKI